MTERRKILVCGASGFIGRNLFEALSRRQDCEVFGTYLRHPPPARDHMLRADLTQAEDAHEVTRGVDVLIQAAALTSGAKDIVSRPTLHVTDNVVMNARLFQAAHDNGVRHAVFLSCTVLYPQTLDRPVKESDLDLVNGIHPAYFGGAWMKVYVEKLCELYAKLGRTSFTIVRHSNVYGPHDKYDLDRSHVFGATVAKVMSVPDGGEISVWGDGTEERDLLHVSDLVRFVERAIERQAHRLEVFNVGLGQSTSVAALVRRVVECSGRSLRISFDPTKPTIPGRLVLDCGKARERLGWEPEVSLDEGIRRTLDWYREAHRP